MKDTMPKRITITTQDDAGNVADRAASAVCYWKGDEFGGDAQCVEIDATEWNHYINDMGLPSTLQGTITHQFNNGGIAEATANLQISDFHYDGDAIIYTYQVTEIAY